MRLDTPAEYRSGPLFDLGDVGAATILIVLLGPLADHAIDILREAIGAKLRGTIRQKKRKVRVVAADERTVLFTVEVPCEEDDDDSFVGWTASACATTARQSVPNFRRS